MTYIKPIVVALALISMTACSGSKKEQPKLDYQSQSHRLVKLEVPPDLNNPDQGNLYQLPAGSGAVRASDFNKTPHSSRTTTCQMQKFLKSVKRRTP